MRACLCSQKTSVLLTLLNPLDRLVIMSEYASLLGKRVEAHYRASDLHLSAVGTLVADSGRSVFIEDHFVQNGREKKMRLEIPYLHLFRISEKVDAPEPAPQPEVSPLRTWQPPLPKRP